MKLINATLVKRAWPENRPLMVPWYLWDGALRLGYVTDNPARFRKVPAKVGGK